MLNKFKPRKKVLAGGLAGALAILAITFLPRLGVNLTEDEKSAVQGAIIAVLTTVGTAYLVPGEPLKEEREGADRP
jgi:hypothetical protein